MSDVIYKDRYYTVAEVMEQTRDAIRGDLVSGLLDRSGISILHAAPKVGKSVLYRQLICSLVQPGSATWLGRRVMTKGGVSYYPQEERLSDVLEHLFELGMPEDADVLFRWHTHSARQLMAEITSDYEEKGVVLAVVDPLISIFPKVDFNDYSEVRSAFQPVIDGLRKLPVHVMFVHHDVKAETTSHMGAILGSQALPSVVDTAIRIVTRNDIRYASTSAQRSRHHWALRDYQLPYVPPIIQGEHVWEDESLSVTEAVLAYVEENPGMSATQVVDAIGKRRADVLQAVKDLVEQGDLTRTGGGRYTQLYKS